MEGQGDIAKQAPARKGRAGSRRDGFGFPAYSARERRIDAIVHGLGLVGGLAGIAWLIASHARQGSVAERLAIVVYGGSLGAMLLASAAYNLSRPGPRKETFRRLDHAAIFALIAGTYTPFAATAPTAGAPLWAVWSAAAAGAVAKLALPRRHERLGVFAYLGLGWALLVLSGPSWSSLPDGVLPLLCAGGVLYTVGTGIHLLEAVPHHNAAWHALVLAAAGCHFAAVASLQTA